MKNKLVFAVAALALMLTWGHPAKAACDGSYQTLIYTEQGGASLHACSGASVTIEAGATLTLASTSSLVQTNVDLTEKSLTATFGINGATLAVSGAASVGSLASAGAITGTTLHASGAATIVEALYLGAANTVSTFTAAGAATFPGAVTAAAINISGSGQALIGNATATQLATLVPGQAKGTLIMNSTDSTLCVSTAAAAGSWALPRGPAKDSAFVSCY